MTYRVTAYKNIVNLGDAIQTIALCQWLTKPIGIVRHFTPRYKVDDNRIFIVNGYWGTEAPPKKRGTDCLFAGVHFADNDLKNWFIDWARWSPYPFGARDPKTASFFSNVGLPHEMTGCASVTFPRYEGPRKGIICVDIEKPGEKHTHLISTATPWEDQWKLGLAALERYRTAECVYTTRLHVALPCLAFGTPVWVKAPQSNGCKDRFSIFDALGISFGEIVQKNMSPWKEKYLGFLGKHVCISEEAKVPECPEIELPI